MKVFRLFCIVSFYVLVMQACDTGTSVLFQDDFSDPASKWNRVRDANGNITDYENGGYRILNNQPISHVWANPGLSFKNVHIEVDATKIGGPDDNLFGIICRYKDGSNFYILAISSDGYFGIVKVQNGMLDLLGAQEMQPSEAILQGNATNHLRADCVGNTLTLYVNGQELAAVQDGNFTSGDVGLEVTTRQIQGVDILFDNYSVTKP
jgi:hypothetical protein